jgi:hypothetical protein
MHGCRDTTFGLGRGQGKLSSTFILASCIRVPTNQRDGLDMDQFFKKKGGELDRKQRHQEHYVRRSETTRHDWEAET